MLTSTSPMLTCNASVAIWLSAVSAPVPVSAAAADSSLASAASHLRV
jgi:hypothetical protein